MRSLPTAALPVLLLLIAGACYAEGLPPKAECTEKTIGRLWPAAANVDSGAMQKQAGSGELWMCEGDYASDAYFPSLVHFFKWRQLTVKWSKQAGAPRTSTVRNVTASQDSR